MKQKFRVERVNSQNLKLGSDFFQRQIIAKEERHNDKYHKRIMADI